MIVAICSTMTMQTCRMCAHRAFLELVIMHDDNATVASECEVMLYAKDGVYMMQIPRLVPAMYLPTAGRAEILIRCDVPAGTMLYMSAGTPATYNGAATVSAHQPAGLPWAESARRRVTDRML